jgi:glucokinase
MDKKYICLDIGGTKILGVLFDQDDKILCRVKKKTRVEKGIQEIEENIISVVEELAAKSGLDMSELAGIAAGAPGVINEETGEIIFSPNLPWRNYNIRAAVEKRFNVPFRIGNDANVGILGEWKYGAGKGFENIVALFVGTGIGGGLILGNRLFTGSRHAAAELGHITLNTEGPYCNCGQRGCLEAYASKVGITREIKMQLDRGRESVLTDILQKEEGVIKSKALKKAVEAGDALALEVLDRAAYYLAAGSGSLINIFNPDLLILGGGVMEALGDYIMPLFDKYIRRFSWPEAFAGTGIVQAKLGDDAIIYGALSMVKVE